MACGAPADRYLAIPQPLEDEGAIVVVVEDDSGRSIVALDPSAPILETKLEGEGVVFAFYLRSLPVEIGKLTLALPDACRSFGLGDHRRAFRADLDVGEAFEAIDDVPLALTDLRFEAPCPCVRFEPTEIPLHGANILDVEKIDDDEVLVISREGAEIVDVRTRTSRLQIAERSLRSTHITSDGRRWYGTNDGRLFVETATGGLSLALAPPDTTALRYLTGPSGAPLELLMMHDSGFVRRWDGTTLTELVDDAYVSQTENNGALESIGHGHAILSQSNGSGIHTWQVDRSPPVIFEGWDDVARGPIKRIAWLDTFGFRLATRSGLVFASSNGTDWSRVVSEGSNQVGSVGGFCRFREGVVEARERSGIQFLPADRVYCPFQEFGTAIAADTVIPVGDAVLVIGDTPDGATPLAYLFEAVP